MLREHVTRQSLKPYWQWRSYSYFNVTWTFYLHNTVATNRQYLALSKALQSISLSSNFLHACIDSDTYLHIYFLCLQVSRQVQPYTSDLWHPTVYRHVSFITFTLLSGKISTVNYERQQLSTQSLNVSAQPLPLAVLALQPPQFGTHYPLVPIVLPLQTLSIAFLKLTASSRPTAPPSGSAKCLRFGHWLTLCTLNMHLLTYLLFCICFNFSCFVTVWVPWHVPQESEMCCRKVLLWQFMECLCKSV